MVFITRGEYFVRFSTLRVKAKIDTRIDNGTMRGFFAALRMTNAYFC